ncbi:MAG: choice-of-anchor tandem repeat GloVer-containing protein [Rhodospirillales bacterium]
MTKSHPEVNLNALRGVQAAPARSRLICANAVCLSLALLAALATAAPSRAHATEASYRVLYSFTGGADGGTPRAGLLRDSAGNLYGTTLDGGAHRHGPYGSGTVFRIAPDRTETVLHSFGNGRDGAYPAAGLIADSSGNLYGTTSGVGPDGIFVTAGNVFRLTPANKDKLLYAFQAGSDGAFPNSSLVRDSAGNIYGTTAAGANGDQGGSIFKLTRFSKEFLLHEFAGGFDGAFPLGGLIEDSKGNLYGTTTGGGGLGLGVAFKLAKDGTMITLHAFAGGSDGATPDGGLVVDKFGNLYGTTQGGGAADAGTVFKITPNGVESVLCAFAGGSAGAYPMAGLVIDAQGNLYGTTYAGGAGGVGTVFRLEPDGAELVLHSFVGGKDGAEPMAALVADTKGYLYGTTSQGGAEGRGTVFKVRE